MMEFTALKAFGEINRRAEGREEQQPSEEQAKGDMALEEMQWAAAINRIKAQGEEFDVGLSQSRIAGLTEEQIKEQRQSAISRMKWTKATNARKMFKMVCTRRLQMPRRPWLCWRISRPNAAWVCFVLLVVRRETDDAERRQKRYRI